MKKNKKGFTLIELLVVIAIIGLLATLAVVSLGSARAKARDAKRMGDMRAFQTAVELYLNDNGEAPILSSWEALDALLASYLTGGLPADPGSTEYVYCIDTVTTPDNNKYLVHAVLEESTSIDGDIDTLPTWLDDVSSECVDEDSTTPVVDCTDVNGGFCLGVAS